MPEVRVIVSSELPDEFDSGLAECAAKRAIEVALGQRERPVSFGLQPVLQLGLTFVGDARIRELNRDYRHLDQPTDVLSFSQIEGLQHFVAAPAGMLELGDIVISVETAARQAAAQQHSLESELAHLAAHGALHLLGYEHETDQDEARMNALAAAALSR